METYSSKISENGGDELMSSRQGSLASHLAAPESEMERKMTAISGRRCFVSSTKLDRLGLLVKTLVESSRWYSPARRLKWEVTRTFAERITRFTRNDNGSLSSKSESTSRQSDIQSRQLLYRLVPSERPTGETGCGFWQEGMMLPTPMAQDYRRRGPNSEQQGLPEMAYNGLLPTPNATEGEKFATTYNPNSQMGQSLTVLAVNGMIEGASKSLTGKTSLQLNPLFVEEMMGMPLDYLVSPFQDGDKNR